MEPLLELIEEFQQLMNQIMDLTEETNAEVKQMTDLAIPELPAQINAILDLCAEGSSNFQKASALAEEIRRILG